MKEMSYDLTFYYTHNQLFVPQYNFRVLEIYNFGPGDKELQKWCLANSISPKKSFYKI